MEESIALENFWSVGVPACGLYATLPAGPFSTTSFLCNKRVLFRGITHYIHQEHGNSDHTQEMRVIVDPGNSTFFLEGKPVALTWDLIGCGDRIQRNQDCQSFG